MRFLFFLLFLLISNLLLGQTFLKSYKDFYRVKINQNNKVVIKNKFNKNIKSTNQRIKKTKKIQLRLLNKQAQQFDTIFKTYKKNTGFDFNTANSITLIYQTEVESNLRDFIIYSGKDTISYSEFLFVDARGRTIKKTQYKPFLDTISRPKGVKVINVRDSLLTIATKRNCGTVQLQMKDNKILDGNSATIVIATKKGNQFYIEECFLEPFGFVPIWRKE